MYVFIYMYVRMYSSYLHGQFSVLNFDEYVRLPFSPHNFLPVIY